MKNITALSVLMPVYNAATYLKPAIESVLRQSFDDFEFIIINDGSEDNSAEIISSFKDSRIIFINEPENKGVACRKIQLLKAANGEYLTFMDSDDLINPDKFRTQITFLKLHPEIGMTGTNAIIIDHEGKEKRKLRLSAKPHKIPAILIFRNYFVNSAVMFRKSVLTDIDFEKCFDYEEDYWLWWQISRKTKVINLPDFFTFYREHPGSLSSKVMPYRKEIDKRLFQLIFNDLKLQTNDEELDLHYSITQPEGNYCLNHQKKLITWFKKIKKSAVDSGIKKINPVLRNRWLKVCYKSRRNPLCAINGIFQYFRCFKLFFS